MKVLLVEDVDESRDVLRRMLETFGHRVIEAANGRDAVRLALEDRPDLVFMDLSMPEIDGFQTTGALRAISRFGRSNLPIVAITAYPETLSKEKAFASGCDAYLRKPVDLSDLALVFKRLLLTA